MPEKQPRKFANASRHRRVYSTIACKCTRRPSGQTQEQQSLVSSPYSCGYVHRRKTVETGIPRRNTNDILRLFHPGQSEKSDPSHLLLQYYFPNTVLPQSAEKLIAPNRNVWQACHRPTTFRPLQPGVRRPSRSPEDDTQNLLLPFCRTSS